MGPTTILDLTVKVRVSNPQMNCGASKVTCLVRVLRKLYREVKDRVSRAMLQEITGHACRRQSGVSHLTLVITNYLGVALSQTG